MTIHSHADLAALRRVGRLVAGALARLVAEVRPGVSTRELDEVGARFLRAHGARSAPQLTYGFPGFNLISLNDEIVHGVPGGRRLRAGDVVKLDVTAELDGYIADAARTVLLPGAPAVARRLARCARRAFRAALGAAQPGRPVRVLGRAVTAEAARAGFAVIPELAGHGVGRQIHEAPPVPNFDDPGGRTLLRDGLVLAVEPLLAERPVRVVEDDDGWTLRTDNGALAVHYENTIVIRRGRPLVLTAA